MCVCVRLCVRVFVRVCTWNGILLIFPLRVSMYICVCMYVVAMVDYRLYFILYVYSLWVRPLALVPTLAWFSMVANFICVTSMLPLD